MHKQFPSNVQTTPRHDLTAPPLPLPMTYDSALGPLLIECKGEALVALRPAGPADRLTPSTPASDEAMRQVGQYIAGTRRQFELRTELCGTPFQLKVWAATCSIPYGETRTYAQIAQMIGSPKAARAVGMALRRNPLMMVVPCHRVVGASGDLTGFAFGIEIKRRLLELERNNGTTSDSAT